MGVNGLHAFAGWSNGYQFGLLNTKEDEVRQGKNYYMGSFVQIGKFNILNSNVSFFVEQIPDGIAKTAGRVACFFAPFIGLVAFPFCAAVKSGHYDTVRDLWDRYKPEEFPQFPRALSERATLVCNFVTENAGDIMRVIAIVSAVAFAVFVSPSFGIGMFVGLGLEAADNAGMLPRKVSLFMERYMPTVSSIGTLVYGGFLLRVISLISIAMVVVPGAQLYVHHRVDDFAKDVLGIQGRRLSEYEAPLQNNKQMTYDEIMRVLNSTAPFVIDPAHCSKGIIDAASLPVDDDFDKFMPIFDRIDWASKYEIIKGKISDDDRFIDFLSEQFPNIPKSKLNKGDYFADNARFINFLRRSYPAIREDVLTDLPLDPDTTNPYLMHKPEFMDFLSEQVEVSPDDLQTVLNSYRRLDAYYPQFEACIETLAERDELTKEQYAARWMREQMAGAIDVLMGRVRVKGQQEDLQDAIDNAAKIIPYLEGLDPVNDRIEIEDCLMKLTVEGGNYCARALKRSTSEIVDGIVRKLTVAETANAEGDAGFEIKIRGSLQELRYGIIQGIYQEMMALLQVPGAIAMDVHMMDVYRLALSLGFSPLTEQERRNVGVAQLVNWEQFSTIREQGMMGAYESEIDEKLQETIDQVGAIHFANYARNLIGENTNLSTEQKETLTDMIANSWENPWASTLDSFADKIVANTEGLSREEKKTLKETTKKQFSECFADEWGIENYEGSEVSTLIELSGLTGDQKAIVREGALRDWNKTNAQKNFRRLALVSMGILKKS